MSDMPDGNQLYDTGLQSVNDVDPPTATMTAGNIAAEENMTCVHLQRLYRHCEEHSVQAIQFGSRALRVPAVPSRRSLPWDAHGRV